MQMDGIPVKTKTIAYILQKTLRSRQQGRRPMILSTRTNDLDMAIGILMDIMKSGSFVPVTFWREIIRRLGMLGRFKDLDRLCLFLAFWYGPVRNVPSTYGQPLPRHRRVRYRHRVPAQVPTSHPLHPLKILFSVSLQKAIVEWGFIHALCRTPKPPNNLMNITRDGDSPSVSVACGITLLKRLDHHGVHIDGAGVRSAIFNRLVTYYGPGRSKRLYNRAAKLNNRLELKDMVRQVDQAFGMQVFPKVNLQEAIESSGRLRLQRRSRLRLRRLAAPGLAAPRLAQGSL